MAFTLGPVVTHGEAPAVWTITGPPQSAMRVVITLDQDFGHLRFYIGGDYSGTWAVTPAPVDVNLGAVHLIMTGLALHIPAEEVFDDSGSWRTFEVTGSADEVGPTLRDLALQVRERADMVESAFVTDAEIGRFLKQSLLELHDLVIQKYGDDYFVSSALITADGAADEYALPNDFYKLRGVDLQLGSAWRSIHPFSFGDRNQWSGAGTEAQYRLQGNKIKFAPVPASGQVFKLWYVPRWGELAWSVPSAVESVGQKAMSGMWDCCVWDKATGEPALAPVGGRHTVLMTPFGPAAGPWMRFFIDGGLEVASAEVVFPPEGESPVADIDLGSVSTALAGLQLHIEQKYLMNEEHMRTAGWAWDTGVSDSALDIRVSQWAEYVVVDAAIKCLVKEESDPSALMAQKATLVQRIESAAENRDAGAPMCVSEVSRRSVDWTATWEE